MPSFLIMSIRILLNTARMSAHVNHMIYTYIRIGSDWAESEVELTISDEISLLQCFHSKHKMK